MTTRIQSALGSFVQSPKRAFETSAPAFNAEILFEDTNALSLMGHTLVPSCGLFSTFVSNPRQGLQRIQLGITAGGPYTDDELIYGTWAIADGDTFIPGLYGSVADVGFYCAGAQGGVESIYRSLPTEETADTDVFVSSVMPNPLTNGMGLNYYLDYNLYAIIPLLDVGSPLLWGEVTFTPGAPPPP